MSKIKKKKREKEKEKQRESEAIFSLFDTFGHELTHHVQSAEMRKYRGMDLDVDGIKDFFKLMLDKKIIREIDDIDSLAEFIRLESYLNGPTEQEAREKGKTFAEQTFEILLDNKYISKKHKELLKLDKEEYQKQIEEDETLNIEVVKNYKSFENILEKSNWDFMVDFENQNSDNAEKNPIYYSCCVN